MYPAILEQAVPGSKDSSSQHVTKANRWMNVHITQQDLLWVSIEMEMYMGQQHHQGGPALFPLV